MQRGGVLPPLFAKRQVFYNIPVKSWMKWRVLWVVLVPVLASALSFQQAQEFYAYPKAPFQESVKDVVTLKRYGYTRTHLTIASGRGYELPALLYFPTRGAPPYPCIFFMHFHVSDKSLAELAAMQWARKGFCLFAIDGIYRGERKVEGKDILDPDPSVTVENMKTQILDILRGLDYLASRKDVDGKRIGFFGISMGAITGAVATALSPVPSVIALADAGGDLPTFFQKSSYGDVKKSMEYIRRNNLDMHHLAQIVEFVDPLAFARFLAPRPILMLNGKKDTIVPVPNIKKLFSALSEPKKILWYDSDHYLPIPKVLLDVGRFFKEHFREHRHSR